MHELQWVGIIHIGVTQADSVRPSRDEGDHGGTSGGEGDYGGTSGSGGGIGGQPRVCHASHRPVVVSV